MDVSKINKSNINKEISNIYLFPIVKEVTLPKLRFPKFKKLVSRPVFAEFQLTQISANFKISCCNLKIREVCERSEFLYLCFVFEIFY